MGALDRPAHPVLKPAPFIVILAGVVIAALTMVVTETHLIDRLRDRFNLFETAADSSPPTRANAVNYLAALHDRAKHSDAAAFCADSEAVEMCENEWKDAGGSRAVPPGMPTILSSRVDGPFRVLTVCGTDGLSRPYQSDLPVRTLHGRPSTALTVFWVSKMFKGSGDGQPIQVGADGGLPANSSRCPPK
jgi:hypothetical protein